MIVRGFIKLLRRYQNGTLPASVKEVMDIWYKTIRNEPIENNNKAEIRERIWLNISQNLDGPRQEEIAAPKPLRSRLFYMAKIAAVFLVFLGIVLYSSNNWLSRKLIVPKNETGLSSSWMEEVNAQKTTRHILLADGSKVVLEPGSKLRFPKNFEPGFRKVYLEGSGFFDVTKNPERPFLVYSGSVLTRVLGTSFIIKSLPKTGGTEVSVVTGKVTVEKVHSEESSFKTGEKENRVVLTPNKKVTFFKNSEHYITGLVANPVLLANQKEYLKPHAFNFDDAPLADVLETLEKAYGVDITLSNDSILECPITADLSGDNLYEKMEIIGAVLNARYEITGSSILLTGGGCLNAKTNPKP